MQRKTLLTLCAATVLAGTAALGIVMAKPASLLVSTSWVGETSTDWHDSANWTNGVPAAGVTVTVNQGAGINYKGPPGLGSNGAAGDLTIGGGASVTVNSATLTLDLDVIHDFNGDLFLTNSSSILKFVDNDATVDGDGAIIGQHNSAKIQIEGAKKLTSTMLIQGKMTIETDGGTGDGKFVNGSTGIVWANAAGILLFDGSLTLDDEEVGGARALWKATSGSSTFLQFGSGLTFVDSNPELEGDFVLCGDANIVFDVQVRTGGCFDETTANGVLDLAGNDYFCDTDTSCGDGDVAECYDSGTTTFNGNC